MQQDWNLKKKLTTTKQHTLYEVWFMWNKTFNHLYSLILYSNKQNMYSLMIMIGK